MLRKFPELRRVRRMARLAEQPAAWTHYLVGRRRGRAAFNPAHVARLRLWLKADSLALANNSPVSAWADSSDSGNGVEQPTGMKRPTFKTNQLNRLPVLRFDGIDDTLVKYTATGFSCATGHSIVAVMNPVSAGSLRMGVVTNYGSNELRQNFAGGWAEWTIPSGYTTIVGSVGLAGVWAIWTGTYEVATATLELFINGVSQGTESDTDWLSVNDIYIGSRSETYNWLGDIAEVLVYDAALTTADRVGIEGYLKAKA